ncbi:MAG: 2-phospho-L-lactate transferase CofD family protein [Candidatus Micrarchaeaceae archaeon]
MLACSEEENLMQTLNLIGCGELLKIGDQDRAIKIQKTLLLKNNPLSKVVDIQRNNLGIKSKIIPMSDQKSHININTNVGDLDFHQFLIELRGEPEVLSVDYNQVEPAPGVIESIENSDMVIIGPSNPVTSVGPIISMQNVRNVLKKSYVVGVSPIIGDKPVSGPADKFMHALGYDVSSCGVANMYQNFLDKFFIDLDDIVYEEEIEKLISEVVVTNTNMKNIEDKMMLARNILGEFL